MGRSTPRRLLLGAGRKEGQGEGASPGTRHLQSGPVYSLVRPLSGLPGSPSAVPEPPFYLATAGVGSLLPAVRPSHPLRANPVVRCPEGPRCLLLSPWMPGAEARVSAPSSRRPPCCPSALLFSVCSISLGSPALCCGFGPPSSLYCCLCGYIREEGEAHMSVSPRLAGPRLSSHFHPF